MVGGRTSTCARRGETVTAVIVWVLLGAIVNVAVAWGCALVVDGDDADDIQRGVERTERGNWEVFTLRRFGTERVQLLLFARDIAESGQSVHNVLPPWCRRDVRAAVEIVQPFPLGKGLYIEARGWPAVSLVHELCHDNNSFSARGSLDVGLAHFDGNFRSPRRLPLWPLWPGFAINTIFYATLLWMVFAVPGMVRRRLRVNRGLCAACAYPVGMSEVCSECGGRVRRG